MKILVNRIVSNRDVTISRVYLNGQFFCHGLEDEYRLRKVPGETRIPTGCYELGLRTVGGFHKRYSSMFPGFHEGMIEIRDVPDFKYVLIHVGNFDRDTAGCLLLGKADFGAWAVWQSKRTYLRFYERVLADVDGGNSTILFQDSDR